MLERTTNRAAATTWGGASRENAAHENAAHGNKDRSRMLLALVLLLVGLTVVVVKDREIWFGADATASDDETPVTAVASSAVQVASVPVVAKAKGHASSKASTVSPVAQPAMVTTARTALPPLEVEVVADGAHRTVQASRNSVKVEMLNSGTGAARTTVAERAPIVSDKVLALRQSAGSQYPSLAGQMKVEGSVLLQALIGADGGIRDLRVLSGPAILSAAARQAVLEWKFKPYLENGQAVATQAKISVNFTIKVTDDGPRDNESARKNKVRQADAQPATPGA